MKQDDDAESLQNGSYDSSCVVRVSLYGLYSCVSVPCSCAIEASLYVLYVAFVATGSSTVGDHEALGRAAAGDCELAGTGWQGAEPGGVRPQVASVDPWARQAQHCSLFILGLLLWSLMRRMDLGSELHALFGRNRCVGTLLAVGLLVATFTHSVVTPTDEVIHPQGKVLHGGAQMHTGGSCGIIHNDCRVARVCTRSNCSYLCSMCVFVRAVCPHQLLRMACDTPTKTLAAAAAWRNTWPPREANTISGCTGLCSGVGLRERSSFVLYYCCTVCLNYHRIDWLHHCSKYYIAGCMVVFDRAPENDDLFYNLSHGLIQQFADSVYERSHVLFEWSHCTTDLVVVELERHWVPSQATNTAREQERHRGPAQATNPARELERHQLPPQATNPARVHKRHRVCLAE